MTAPTEAQVAARRLARWFNALAAAYTTGRPGGPLGWSVAAEQRHLPRWQRLAADLGGQLAYELWSISGGGSPVVYAALDVTAVPGLSGAARISGDLDGPAAERAVAAHPELAHPEGDATPSVVVSAAEWLAIVTAGAR